jgi:hypothetical protein
VYDCGSSATCQPPIDLSVGTAGQHPYSILYYKLVSGNKVCLAGCNPTAATVQYQ